MVKSLQPCGYFGLTHLQERAKKGRKQPSGVHDELNETVHSWERTVDCLDYRGTAELWTPGASGDFKQDKLYDSGQM